MTFENIDVLEQRVASAMKGATEERTREEDEVVCLAPMHPKVADPAGKAPGSGRCGQCPKHSAETRFCLVFAKTAPPAAPMCRYGRMLLDEGGKTPQAAPDATSAKSSTRAGKGRGAPSRKPTGKPRKKSRA